MLHRGCFQQFMKKKRARFGIKLVQLCTSNGIPLDFFVYHGNIAPSSIEMGEGTLVTEKIPATLMQWYLHKGLPIYSLIIIMQLCPWPNIS